MTQKFRTAGKATIIGAGYVGASIAYAMTITNTADEIALVDIDRKKAKGEADDIRHATSGIGNAQVYAGGYHDCTDSDLIIITAGRGRKAGESRLDLTIDNLRIMRDVIKSVQRYYNGGAIMVISNPVDILTAKAAKWMKLPDGVIFSSGCMLDSSRFRRSIADYVFSESVEDKLYDPSLVRGYVAGEHGDQQVPVWSSVTVCGIPVEEYCIKFGIEWNDAVKAKIAQATKSMGASIIKAKGRTNYGIATCACRLAQAVLNDRQIVASVSTVLLDKNGAALSVPSVVGKSGVIKRFCEGWSVEESAAFDNAAKSMIKILDDLPEIFE